MTDHIVTRRVSDGLVLIRHARFGEQLWTRATMRKRHGCESCPNMIAPGESAFRPVTNGYNRMHRLCVSCASFRAFP